MALFGKEVPKEPKLPQKPGLPKRYFSGRELREAARKAPAIIPGTRRPLSETERIKEIEELFGPMGMAYGIKRETVERKLKDLEKSVWRAKTFQEKQEIREKIQRLKHVAGIQ